MDAIPTQKGLYIHDGRVVVVKNREMLVRFNEMMYLCKPIQSSIMHYADVILPVPLHVTFTYAIPEGLSVVVGVRVLVPFGRGKKYVGLVDRLHDQKPQDYVVKDRSSNGCCSCRNECSAQAVALD